MESLLPPSALTPPTDGRELDAWLTALENHVVAVLAAKIQDIALSALHRYAGTLTAAGDPGAFDDMNAQWSTFVSTDFGDLIGSVHSSGALSSFQAVPVDVPEAAAGRWAAVMNDQAATFQASATNRLVGVGDEMWSKVRSSVVDNLNSGAGPEALKQSIEQISSFSEFRADTIGRTETLAAYNAGDFIGGQALGEYGPVEKYWMAALDNRTRASHAEADGQTVGYNDAFNVGGYSMMYPLDSSAAPEEVVNCRCTTGTLYPGDERPDGTIVEGLAAAPTVTTVDAAEADETSVAQVLSSEAKPRGGIPYVNIDAAADKFGVSRVQVASYLRDAPLVVKGIKAEAATTAADSFSFLDRFEGLRLQRPPKGVRGGEYDFLERLHPKERDRLSAWWTDSPSAAIDVVFDEAVRVGAIASDASIDDFTQTWLHHNRIIDGSKSLRSGRFPDGARFGSLDPVVLAPQAAQDGIDIAQIIGKDQWDQAGYLAERGTAQAAEDAYRALGADRLSGEAPWRMSFDTWRGEVADAEYDVANGVDVAAANRRLAELIPYDLDSGQGYEELYAEIVETAKVARVDVAEWATIPWAV